jgi:hypothetical protein
VLMVSLFPLTISSITIPLCTIVFSSDIQPHTHLKYGCQIQEGPTVSFIFWLILFSHTLFFNANRLYILSSLTHRS